MAIAAYPATIKLGSNTVNDIMTYDLPFKMDTIETTSFSGAGASTGTQTYILGLYGLTVKAAGSWNKGDTNGQLALETAFFGRTAVSVVISPNAVNTYSFTAWVSGYTIKAEAKNKVSVDFELTMNGAVTLA